MRLEWCIFGFCKSTIPVYRRLAVKCAFDDDEFAKALVEDTNNKL